MQAIPSDNWPDRAERICRLLPRDRLNPVADHFLRSGESDGRWTMACSGGGDSVCLALIAYGHFPERRRELSLVHFNHALREVESDEDQKFVEELGQALGLPVDTARWERSGGASVSEEEAREARFEFFREVMANLGSHVLMLGHHGDDIAENLLMRIARGSGITGLAGLRPVHRVDRGIIHVRPLLDMDRSTIHGVLQAAGVPWREDSSNAGDRYVRNRVRRLVIPAWRAAVTHDPVRGAIRSRTLLEEDAVALDTWLRLLVGEPEKKEPHSLAALKGKPKALIRRAVIRFLRRHGLELSLGPKPVETLIKAVATGEQCRMSGGPSGFITCCDSVLQYRPLAEPATWRPFLAPVGSFVFFPDGGCLAVHMLKVDQKLQEQILRKEIDPDREAVISWPRGTQQVLLRRWAPGDRLRPLGAPGERKLQDVFGDRRIPPAERKRLPLVFTVEGELLWVPGVPPAESFKIEPRTRHALRLTYIGT